MVQCQSGSVPGRTAKMNRYWRLYGCDAKDTSDVLPATSRAVASVPARRVGRSCLLRRDRPGGRVVPACTRRCADPLRGGGTVGRRALPAPGGPRTTGPVVGPAWPKVSRAFITGGGIRMPTRPTSRRRRLAALASALVLPAAAVVATPSPAAAGTTYCYTVIAADPSGWIFGWGTAGNCIQPVGVEVHLREDISWAPDREVSNHYGSPGQFLDV